jgi:hypothetical protein
MKNQLPLFLLRPVLRVGGFFHTSAWNMRIVMSSAGKPFREAEYELAQIHF